MKKILLQGFTILILFFASWLILRQVDWITVLKIEKNTKRTEEKLGELFWEIFRKTGDENKNQFINKSVDSLVNVICLSNKINRSHIKIHILNKDEINAFALPDGHLLLYTGLIYAADKPEELSGVICHEIAHIHHNHVMKKLVKEVGLSVLLSMTTGNGGSEIMKEVTKKLSSSAFDRNLEKEADIKAVDYLANANITPGSLADFLYKISDTETINYPSWVSTHPDSKERAEYIIDYAKDKTVINKPVLKPGTWEKLKEKLKE